MACSKIAELIGHLKKALEELGAHPTGGELERIAFLVNSAMGGPARIFHTIDHVFGFLPAQDGVETLAALFHDIVYVPVDGGFPPEVGMLLAPYISTDGATFSLPSSVPDTDRWYHNVRSIFGFDQGHYFDPPAGLNEFYSALAAGIILGPLLPQGTLTEIAACIEATIPFRSADNPGTGPFDTLERRLTVLGMEPEKRAKAMQRAVHMANRDVSDFGSNDAGQFLNGTWKLLPEMNHALRVQGHYNISQYRGALEGMEKFTRSLEARRIFHHWKGEPSRAEWESLIAQAADNLEIAREYLQAKLLAIAFLEAAAALTGGDAPISYFMGDLVHQNSGCKRLEAFLPSPQGEPCCEKGIVYHLLESGRMSETSFDMKNSPLALFFYRQCDPTEFQAAVEKARCFFKRNCSPEEYLASWKPEVRLPVLNALAEMVPTRSEAFRKLAGG